MLVITSKFSGLYSHNLSDLVFANDEWGMTFAQIADAIVMSTTRPDVPMQQLLTEVRESDLDHASAREEE